MYNYHLMYKKVYWSLQPWLVQWADIMISARVHLVVGYAFSFPFHGQFENCIIHDSEKDDGLFV